MLTRAIKSKHLRRVRSVTRRAPSKFPMLSIAALQPAFSVMQIQALLSDIHSLAMSLSRETMNVPAGLERCYERSDRCTDTDTHTCTETQIHYPPVLPPGRSIARS
ncbi:hypothetical protein GDO78_010660 [Eleutherodactylus coqui]|uniref:Uncharacterized protein n=1 Tax=Eleutherodactylus coqui TaxID=57060 RepID=A0A8J6F3W0_ELECQ|nr:hypothetical protein GDO78_010660 [Eleutherodactylus coqui]